MMNSDKELLSPLWYALGSVVAVPLVALLMLFGSVAMICAWVFIPFLCYFKRREEIANLCNEELPVI